MALTFLRRVFLIGFFVLLAQARGAAARKTEIHFMRALVGGTIETYELTCRSSCYVERLEHGRVERRPLKAAEVRKIARDFWRSLPKRHAKKKTPANPILFWQIHYAGSEKKGSLLEADLLDSAPKSKKAELEAVLQLESRLRDLFRAD